MKGAVLLADREIVDAREPALHVSRVIEFPVLIAVTAEPEA
jgi:hypothetical protein